MTQVLLRKNRNLLLLVLLLLSLAGFNAPVRAGDPSPAAVPETTALIDNGGYGVKKNGDLLLTYNLDKLYVPASILKIATALAALEVMGPGYRFTTGFYRDGRNNLYIKGYGDPFLTSEEVAVIVNRLKELGCTEINDIYLDNTAFDLEGEADGAGASPNPFDARNSGLAVNFNTVNIRIDPAGRVASAEEQTPTLELMAELAAGLEPGLHRVNISRQNHNGDSVVSRYAGELFRAFQHRENIGGRGRIAPRKTPTGLEPFYLHRSSRTLADIIEPLMLYSNNFIANQLFLGLGAERLGYPATWKKSRQVMTDLLQNRFKVPPEAIMMVEGSGLSRRNRISPRAMLELLDAFEPYAGLLPRQQDRLMKSGTLNGVYSYAGYFVTGERLDGFVLLLNQSSNNRDRVLEVLERRYREN